MRAAAVVALVAACHSPPAKTPPTPGDGSAVPLEKLPGLLWVTPPQPWHLDSQIYGLALDLPRHRLLASQGDDLVTVDLSTGVVRADPRHGTGASTILPIGADEWLAITSAGQGLEAMRFDASLAPTPITPPAILTPQAHLDLEAAVLLDGSVAITGSHLPLARYDARTLTPIATIDPEIEWSSVSAGTSTILYAAHGRTAYRFDLAAHTRTELLPARDVAGTPTGVVVGFGYTLTFVPVSGEPKVLSTDATGWALDGSRTRVAFVGHDGILRVVTVDGNPLARFDLGPANHIDALQTVVFDNDTIVVEADTVLRAIDLSAHTVSPAGTPPYGTAHQISLRPDGAVLVTGAAVWRLVDGRVTQQANPAKDTFATTVAGDVVHFATIDAGVIEVHSVDDARLSRRYDNERGVYTAWLGESTQVASVVLGDATNRVVRSSGNKLVTVRPFFHEATVIDIDVDAGIAAVAWRGAVSFLRLTDAAILPHRVSVPGCETYARGAIERRGTRIALWSLGDLYVWDRATGEQTAALSLDKDAISNAQFLPDDEMLLTTVSGLALWKLGTREVRLVPLDDISLSFVGRASEDGHRLAFALPSGRVGLVDLDIVRKTSPKPTSATMPERKSCAKSEDPFAVPLESSSLPDDLPERVPLPER